jgi:hypothetical protein
MEVFGSMDPNSTAGPLVHADTSTLVADATVALTTLAALAPGAGALLLAPARSERSATAPTI